MLIDSHSHLNFKAYKDDLEEVLSRTLKNNVWCINVGTKYETSKQAIEIAKNYQEGVYATVGMHPIHIKTDLVKFKTDKEEGAFETLGEDFDIEKYRELAKSKKVVAIGEIGLDYYYRPKTTKKLEQFKEKQKEIFIKQLELAKELNLPVVVHCRMAHADTLSIFKSQIPNPNDQLNPELRGVIHCFTGNLQEAEEYIKFGFYIGLNGIIFSAQGGPASGWKKELEEVIKNIPLNRILVETDCPYLTPPKAGPKDMRNEPIFVKYVAERIAELKGISFDEVAKVTVESTRKIFNI